MSREWYDMIAKRNGGYKSKANYTVEGRSGEDEFQQRLIQMLPSFNSVLDAGVGHGEFTLKMAQHTKSIVGFDNSHELLKIAQSLKEESGIKNVEFIYACTREELPFANEQFDLVYARRGPTSILEHPRILRTGGTVFGIHSAEIERVKGRLINNGYTDIQIEIFDEAMIYFSSEADFAEFLTAFPGAPDLTIPENSAELDRHIVDNMKNGRLCYPEWRYIWKARKP